MEVKFCRRCAAPLTKVSEVSYKCENGHSIFVDPAPSAACIIVTHDNRIALTVRGIDPGKGKNSLFGGFTNYGESLEEALARELQEEVGLNPDDYETPQYLVSAPEDYEWEGNATRLISIMYLVRIKEGVTLKPADDVADVIYVTPETIPHESIAFPSNLVGIQAAIEALREGK